MLDLCPIPAEHAMAERKTIAAIHVANAPYNTRTQDHQRGRRDQCIVARSPVDGVEHRRYR